MDRGANFGPAKTGDRLLQEISYKKAFARNLLLENSNVDSTLDRGSFSLNVRGNLQVLLAENLN